MKKSILISFFLISLFVKAQAPNAGDLVTIHSATLAEINAIVSPYEGSLVYNSEDKNLYQYNNTTWEQVQPTGNETIIVADDNIVISGSGTAADPYSISSIPAKFMQNSDGSYTFSNGVDPDINFIGMPLNHPIVSSSNATNGSCSQFSVNETRDVIINGNFFDGSATVTIPGQTVNNVTINNTTRITANVTSGGTGGSFDIQVTTDTGSSTLPNGFNVAKGSSTYNLGTMDIAITGAMTYNAGVLNKTSSSGWNAQGYSISHAIPAGEAGNLSFTAVTNDRLRMIGLNSDPATNASYTTLDYAIYLHSNNNVYIYEHGASKGRYATYLPGDNFEVNVDCTGRVSYLKNGSEIYNSATQATGDLYLDSSFHQTNSGISNISMTF